MTLRNLGVLTNGRQRAEHTISSASCRFITFPRVGLCRDLRLGDRPRADGSIMLSMALLIMAMTSRRSAVAAAIAGTRAVLTRFEQAPIVAGTSFAAGFASGRLLEGAFAVYATAADVPSAVLQEHRTISGRVLSVSDGDTLRLRHSPYPWPLPVPPPQGKLSDTTIAVRLIAVDAPEIGKFGSKTQPYAISSRDFVRSRVLNKRVRLTCWQRDRFGRLLAEVRFGPFRANDLSTELLNRGLAVVYRGSDANYGKLSVSRWELLEAKAQASRAGMWIGGVEGVELPSDYKRDKRK